MIENLYKIVDENIWGIVVDEADQNVNAGLDIQVKDKLRKDFLYRFASCFKEENPILGTLIEKTNEL